ncbi:MAG: hypothetical protein KJI72_00570 [Patescibacteria group bacterium]|nr:hypothetical protein [Patescibacteria group bacterium]
MGQFPGDKRGEAGQTLVDILIGLALIALSVSFAVILVFGGQKILIDRDNAVQARVLAKEGFEAARTIRDLDWDGLTDGEHGLTFSGGKWQFSGTSDVIGVLTRKVIVVSESSDTKRIESRVTWQTDPQREQKVELVTLLTDWQNAPPGGGDPGDTGGGGVSGNWQNPQTLGSVDLGPGNEATDLDVLNKIVYISAAASAAAKPDFWIVDATDGENPFIASSLNTSPTLNAIDVSGDYAYVANNEGTAQLQIIDVRDINNPALIVSYRLPGTTEDDTVGNTVFYLDSKVYVGTQEDSDGSEFFIVDVSQPSTPSTLGSYEINDNVNDIHVRDGRAYLATDKGGAGLMVLDVSNPAAITFLGQTFSGDVASVFNIRSSLTLIAPGQDFYTVNTTDPANMTNLGFINVGNVINDMTTRNHLAFLATSNGNREFQVINVSDPTNPTLHSHLNFPQVATGIDYESNLVYISVRSNDALRIITSSP